MITTPVPPPEPAHAEPAALSPSGLPCGACGESVPAFASAPLCNRCEEAMIGRHAMVTARAVRDRCLAIIDSRSFWKDAEQLFCLRINDEMNEAGLVEIVRTAIGIQSGEAVLTGDPPGTVQHMQMRIGPGLPLKDQE